jgi:hypothetical protein
MHKIKGLPLAGRPPSWLIRPGQIALHPEWRRKIGLYLAGSIAIVTVLLLNTLPSEPTT